MRRRSSKRKTSRRSAPTKDQILRTLLSGKKPSDISNSLGVSRQYISYLMKRYELNYDRRYIIKKVDDYYFLFRKVSNYKREYVGFFTEEDMEVLENAERSKSQ